MARKIPLHVSNQNAFVWSTEDAATLRKIHHITGMLTGTLPTMAQQNVFLGMPLLLMPEEVVLLIENQVAILFDDAHGHNPPTAEERKRWEELTKQRRALSIQSLESTRREKENTRGQKSTPAAELKRKEREAKKAQKLAAAAAAAAAAASTNSVADDTSLVTLLAPDEQNVHTPRPSSSTLFTVAEKDPHPAHTIVIPGTSDDHPWFRPPEYDTLDAAREAGIWTYPSTISERAKCAVFRDLIEKGYFIGGGIKFGGDWLVYPGDQLRYHSHFAATVYPTPASKLSPMEIVAHGRLGTGTKKAHLLCGWDDERKVVDYYSVEWANFG